MTENTTPSPIKLSRRDFVVSGLLAGASAGAYFALPKVAYPPIANRVFESWIPQKFGNWTLESTSGVVLPPPDALSDRLYDNLATRVYRSEGAPAVMLLIAYNYKQDGILQLHRPEFCYPAGGYRLSSTEPVTVDLGRGRKVPASIFTAENDERTEQVLYWTRLGGQFPRTWLEQRLSVTRANLMGDIPDGVLMRVSILGADQGEALSILQGFLTAFFDGTVAPLHRMLIGTN